MKTTILFFLGTVLAHCAHLQQKKVLSQTETNSLSKQELETLDLSGATAHYMSTKGKGKGKDPSFGIDGDAQCLNGNEVKASGHKHKHHGHGHHKHDHDDEVGWYVDLKEEFSIAEVDVVLSHSDSSGKSHKEMQQVFVGTVSEVDGEMVYSLDTSCGSAFSPSQGGTQTVMCPPETVGQYVFIVAMNSDSDCEKPSKYQKIRFCEVIIRSPPASTLPEFVEEISSNYIFYTSSVEFELSETNVDLGNLFITGNEDCSDPNLTTSFDIPGYYVLWILIKFDALVTLSDIDIYIQHTPSAN